MSTQPEKKTTAKKAVAKKAVAKKVAAPKKRGRPASKSTATKKAVAQKTAVAPIKKAPAKKAVPVKKTAESKIATSNNKPKAKKIVAPVKSRKTFDDFIKETAEDAKMVVLNISDEIPSEVIWNDMVAAVNETKTSVTNIVDNAIVEFSQINSTKKLSLFKRLKSWLKS